MILDDFVGGQTAPAVVSAPNPDVFYVAKDILDPSVSGLYASDGTQVYTTKMHTTYSFDPDWPGGDGPDATNPCVSGTNKIVTRIYGGTTINTTILDTSTKATGTVEYDLDSLLFDNTLASYGLYEQDLYHDDELLDTTYFLYKVQGGTISFDKDAYYSGDTGTVTWTISDQYFDLDAYSYEAQIFTLDGTEKTSWTVNAKTGTHTITWPASDDPGTYYLALIATDTSDNEEYYFAYDIATFARKVTVAGTVYDAETGATIPNATVNLQQVDEWHNVTATDATYSITDLVSDNQITLVAGASGYASQNYTFTPLEAKTYTQNVYLIPSSPAHAENSTALAGLALSDPYHQAVAGASVTVTNGTYSTTLTSSETGYFLADNLTAGDYTVTASKDGWTTSDTVSVTATEGNVTTTEVTMGGIYALTVEVRDATTHALIPDTCTVELQQDGTTVSTQQTSGGTATFSSLGYGIYSSLTSAEGYYTDLTNTLVDSDTTAAIYLTKKSDSSGAGIQYPPHNVKFTLKTIWGAPVAGATITAQGFETTAGSWDWLKSLLGIDTEETPIQNAEMTGTTDTNGEINFMMIESVKYHVIITSGDQTQEFDVYPKDDNYPITFATTSAWLPEGGDSLASISVNVTTSTDEDTGHILVHYNDTSAKTTSLTIQVTQKNATADAEDVIDTYTVASQSDVSHTFDLSDYKGESYFVRLNATHSEFGTVERDYAVAFKGVRVPIGNLDDGLYIYVAAFILIIVGCFFGATTAGDIGMIVVCFTAWVLWGFGWLDDLGLTGFAALSFATLLSIVATVTKRYREEGYT